MVWNAVIPASRASAEVQHDSIANRRVSTVALDLTNTRTSIVQVLGFIYALVTVSVALADVMPRLHK